MPWAEALKIAAGVGSVLSLCAIFGVLYVWLATRRLDRSIVETVRGQGIVEAASVVRVLKEFSSDEKRIEALQAMLGYDRERASDVVAKVKSDINVEHFVENQEAGRKAWLVIVSAVLIALTVIAYFASNKLEAGEKRSNLEIQGIVNRLGFEKSEPDVLSAIDDLRKYASANHSPPVADEIVDHLRPLVVSHSDTSPKARHIRKAAFEAIKAIRNNSMKSDFTGGLVEADLVDVDLRGADLSGVNLSGSFLMGTDLRNSNLIGANFTDTNIRNVNLSGADLTNVNLTNSDWFNALGVTRDQLLSTYGNTASPCPGPASKKSPLKPFVDDLPGRYVVPYESWPAGQREELRAAWKEYLKPGGVCSGFHRIAP